MSSTGRAVIRGSVGQTLAMGVNILAGLVVLPVLVHGLGDRLYGAWALVGVVMGYYGLVELGVSGAIMRFVAGALGKGDRERADEFISTGLAICLVGSALSVAMTAALALLCSVLIDAPDDVTLFRSVFLIMGVSLALDFPTRCFRGVLRAYLRYDLVSVIETLGSLGRAAASICTVLVGGKLLALAMAVASVSIPQTAAAYYVTRHVHGRIRLNRLVVLRVRAAELLKYGLVTFVAQIADLLRTQIYPLVITPFMGLAYVTAYAIAEKLHRALTRAAAAALGPMAPVFSAQDGRGDEAALRATFYFTYKISCSLTVLLCGTAAVLGEPFILRWIGTDYAHIGAIFRILLIACGLGVSQIPGMLLLYGIAKHRRFAMANIADGAVNVACSVILIQFYGLIGMAVGTVLAAALSRLVLVPMAIAGPLGTSFVRYHAVHTLPNLLRPGVFIIAFAFAARPFLAPDYLRLASIGAVGVLLFIPFIFLIGFNARERAVLRNSASRLWDRRRGTVREKAGQ